MAEIDIIRGDEDLAEDEVVNIGESVTVDKDGNITTGGKINSRTISNDNMSLKYTLFNMGSNSVSLADATKFYSIPMVASSKKCDYITENASNPSSFLLSTIGGTTYMVFGYVYCTGMSAGDILHVGVAGYNSSKGDWDNVMTENVFMCHGAYHTVFVPFTIIDRNDYTAYTVRVRNQSGARGKVTSSKIYVTKMSNFLPV